MKLALVIISALVFVNLGHASERPNVVFMIADDASRHFGSAYNCDWVKTPNIDRVPAYWPDNETVRNDMLDYATEVERFDTHVGEIVKVLDKRDSPTTRLSSLPPTTACPFRESRATPTTMLIEFLWSCGGQQVSPNPEDGSPI